jgi:hypothetical protein
VGRVTAQRCRLEVPKLITSNTTAPSSSSWHTERASDMTSRHCRTTVRLLVACTTSACACGGVVRHCGLLASTDLDPSPVAATCWCCCASAPNECVCFAEGFSSKIVFLDHAGVTRPNFGDSVALRSLRSRQSAPAAHGPPPPRAAGKIFCLELDIVASVTTATTTTPGGGAAREEEAAGADGAKEVPGISGASSTPASHLPPAAKTAVVATEFKLALFADVLVPAGEAALVEAGSCAVCSRACMRGVPPRAPCCHVVVVDSVAAAAVAAAASAAATAGLPRVRPSSSSTVFAWARTHARTNARANLPCSAWSCARLLGPQHHQQQHHHQRSSTTTTATTTATATTTTK